MAFESEPVSIGGWGYAYTPKADDVAKLIKIAEDCGIAKCPELFADLINVVYLGSPIGIHSKEEN